MATRPLRLLHTADWHLGARFHDQRRGLDEAHALEQVVRLAAERRVDVVLVAGDIFDTANPGAEEQQLYYRTLARLVDEAGVGTVVVTAGNHDSALRLDGPRALLESLRIHVVGRLSRNAAPDESLVALRDRDGRERATAVALPYLREGDLHLPDASDDLPERHQRYAHALGARYGACRDCGAAVGLPLVVMGHCYVSGGTLGGLERPVQIGDLGLVDAASLAGAGAGEAAYVALGHLHRPQSVGGRDHWRYSGSLLPSAFDQTGRTREVVIVDLDTSLAPSRDAEAHAASGAPRATIDRVPLEPFRRYERLAGGVEAVRAAVDALDRPGDGDHPPWAEAAVVLDRPAPGLARELAERADARGWRLVSVRREAGGEASEDPIEAGEALGLAALEPAEVFDRKHIEAHGSSASAELAHAFQELHEDLLDS